jgi:hypothetical protein
VDVNRQEVPDMADPAERQNAFARNTNNQFGMNQTLFFEQAMNAAEIGKPLVQNAVKAQIFGGQQNLFAPFLVWAQAQDMTARPMMGILPAPDTKGLVAGIPGNKQPNNRGPFSSNPVRPTHLKVFREQVLNKPKNLIRYEDVEAFFKSKGLDNATAQAMLTWLANNKVVPGKKFTKVYSQWDEWVYRNLSDAAATNKPAVLLTRSHIGTPEGRGHSANEPKVKGLVADHEYPVTAVENENGRKFVSIRNPWGKYGRIYAPDPKDGRPRAIESPDSAISRLPLQEITKRFRRFQIAQISLI